MRPVNMFRGAQVRAASVHTSNWGLARLSNRADSPAMKQTVYNNLLSRINGGTVAIGSLYGFDRRILGEALKRTKDSMLIKLVQTAKTGKFEVTFKGRGIEMVEVINSAGKASQEKRYYEQDSIRAVQGYNLPFFLWMKETIGPERWGSIVKAIAADDRLFSRNIDNLEAKISGTQELLAKHYPLPKRKSIKLT